MNRHEFVLALLIGFGGLGAAYCLIFSLFYRAFKK